MARPRGRSRRRDTGRTALPRYRRVQEAPARGQRSAGARAHGKTARLLYWRGAEKVRPAGDQGDRRESAREELRVQVADPRSRAEPTLPKQVVLSSLTFRL